MLYSWVGHSVTCRNRTQMTGDCIIVTRYSVRSFILNVWAFGNSSHRKIWIIYCSYCSLKLWKRVDNVGTVWRVTPNSLWQHISTLLNDHKKNAPIRMSDLPMNCSKWYIFITFRYIANWIHNKKLASKLLTWRQRCGQLVSTCPTYKMFILLILPRVQGHKVKIIFGTKANDIVSFLCECCQSQANVKVPTRCH